MARLSNVNEGLAQAVGRKTKPPIIYGRHNRNTGKRLSRVYLPLSPQKKLQPSRSWTSINKGQSTREIEDALMPPNSTQKLAANGSLASSPSPKPLRDSIANATIVQSTQAPPMQLRTESNRNPAQSRSKLPPKPTTSESIAGKFATVETPNQAEFPPPEINQLTTGVGNVPVSDDHTQASTAADNLNLGPTDDTEMAEVDGEGDPGETKQSPAHTGDGDDEYFDVEAIKSCKLSSRGMVLFRVKWKGYEDPSDITWEPEKVLRSDIPQVLDIYFEERGGRDKVVNDLREKQAREMAYARKKGVARVKNKISKKGV